MQNSPTGRPAPNSRPADGGPVDELAQCNPMPAESGPVDVPAERRREQRAWYFYDWANSGYVTTTATVLLAPFLTSVAERAACPGLPSGQACEETLPLLGMPVS